METDTDEFCFGIESSCRESGTRQRCVVAQVACAEQAEERDHTGLWLRPVGTEVSPENFHARPLGPPTLQLQGCPPGGVRRIGGWQERSVGLQAVLRQNHARSRARIEGGKCVSRQRSARRQNRCEPPK